MELVGAGEGVSSFFPFQAERLKFSLLPKCERRGEAPWHCYWNQSGKFQFYPWIFLKLTTASFCSFKSEAVARSSRRVDWAPTCCLAPLPSLPPALAHHRLSIAAHTRGLQSLGGDREREVNVTRPSPDCHPSVRWTLEFPVGGQQRCAGQVPRTPQDLHPDC